MPSNEYKSSESEDEDVDERFVKDAGDGYEQEAESDDAAVAHEADVDVWQRESNIKQEYPDHEADNPLIDNYREEIHQLQQSIADVCLNQTRPHEESYVADKDFDDRHVKDITYTAESDNDNTYTAESDSDNTDIDTDYSAARPGKKRKIKHPTKISKPEARSVPSSTRRSRHYLLRSRHYLLRSGKLTGMSVHYMHKGKEGIKGIFQEDGKLLCYCNLCGGKQTVNLTQFEQHAPSALKRPSDNIFVDAFKGSITELARYYDHTIDKFLLPIEAQDVPTLPKPYTSPSLSRNRGTSLKNAGSSKTCFFIQKDNAGSWKISSSSKSSRVQQEEEKVDVLDRCILCSDKYFSTDGFDDKIILMCDRCDREFHVGCLRDKGIANITAFPNDHWFCSPFCSRSYQTLQDYLEKGPTDVEQTLLKPHHKGKLIRWCVIHGARQDANTQGYIKDCGRIFKECFEPLRFQDSKKDMMPYLLNTYTAVSAALFRIFTEEIAELPLIATRKRQQRRGYFQILYACIEDFFREIGIKNLVLPAADAVAQSWKEKLNFTELSQEQLEAYSKLIPILTFEQSVMLIKPLISEADQSP